MRHGLRIAAAIAVMTLVSLLPFLPGPYDPLAVPLSAMAQVFGTAGLILVPFGALRLAAERLPRFARWQFLAATLATIASVPVWGLVFMAAISKGGLVLGSAVLGLVVYVLRRSWRTLTEMRRGTPARRHVMPLYLAAVPLGVAILQYALLDDAAAFSRTRAIRNAAPLIADIERHREEQGQYPDSLLATPPDRYTPGVAGIERYQYARHGEAYDVAFEQASDRTATRELVVYNPRDEQTVTAHARGHDAVHDAAPHWKYFWLD